MEPQKDLIKMYLLQLFIIKIKIIIKISESSDFIIKIIWVLQ